MFGTIKGPLSAHGQDSKNKEKYDKMATESHAWMLKNAVEKPLNHVMSAIEEKKKLLLK